MIKKVNEEIIIGTKGDLLDYYKDITSNDKNKMTQIGYKFEIENSPIELQIERALQNPYALYFKIFYLQVEKYVDGNTNVHLMSDTCKIMSDIAAMQYATTMTRI